MKARIVIIMLNVMMLISCAILPLMHHKASDYWYLSGNSTFRAINHTKPGQHTTWIQPGQTAVAIETGITYTNIAAAFSDPVKSKQTSEQLQKFLRSSGYPQATVRFKDDSQGLMFGIRVGHSKFGLSKSQQSFPVGQVTQLILNNSKSANIYLSIPKYLTSSVNTQPMLVSKRFLIYNTNTFPKDIIVTTKGDISGPTPTIWLACLLCAWLLGLTGIWNLASLADRNDIPARIRLNTAKTRGILPFIISSIISAGAVVTAFIMPFGRIAIDLWDGANNPLMSFVNAIAILTMSIFILVMNYMVCKQFISTKALKEQNTPAISEKTKVPEAKLHLVHLVYMIIPLLTMFKLHISPGIVSIISILTLISPYLYRLRAISLRRNTESFNNGQLEHREQALSYLSEDVANKLQKEPKRVQIDLSDEGANKAWVADQYFGPVMVSGRASTELSDDELKFAIGEKLLASTKQICLIEYLIPGAFLLATGVWLLDKHNVTSILVVLFVSIVIAFISLYARENKGSSINKYKLLLQKVTSYKTAESAILKMAMHSGIILDPDDESTWGILKKQITTLRSAASQLGIPTSEIA